MAHHDPISQTIPSNLPPERGLRSLLDRLETTRQPRHYRVQEEFFGIADGLLANQGGMEALWQVAHRFDAANVFAGGPWADPSQLQVPLVAGTLRGPGVTPLLETLSELRILAIATGRCESPEMPREDAAAFLDEVLARNLRYLFPSDGATEEERESGDRYRESHERLFALIVEEIGLGRVLGEVVDEVEQVLAQRPISTWSVRRMIRRAVRLADRSELRGPAVEKLRGYLQAFDGPTPLSRTHARPGQYRAALGDADVATLRAEAEVFATSMTATGLVAPQHAVLVQFLLEHHPDLLALALDADDAGAVEIESNAELVHQLIEAAVFPTTAQCLYGLSGALNRTLVSRNEVTAGLERLLELDVLEEPAKNLLAHRDDEDTVTASGVLVAGALAVLGQPLGIGQGRNPTCQAARGISLWAQHDPGQLLELIVAAARDGRVELRFDGLLVQSDQIARGVATSLDLDLDPVSIVLVPHLDRLYSELMRRSALRPVDAHKWVNPALYGRWIANELATAFADPAQTTVVGFDAFVRRFFATHHPHYNGNHRLMYPNPVGLVITNHQGKYLGPHAVSIQRVEEDPDGAMRVYFFNPNNEGRQDWGHGVRATVSGHGEAQGESSLPFEHFAARLYAFHYNPFESGELAEVDTAPVAAVTEAAKVTWGLRFIWLG